MPLLQNKQKIAELRRKCPELVHVSEKPLAELTPHVSSADIDRFGSPVGPMVFATSSQSDFYALSSSQGAINYARCWYDSHKRPHRIFIFEKIKPIYYKHIVSSVTFTPIVPKEDVLDGNYISGEWVSSKAVKPIRIEQGKKEDILAKTDARVFTVINLEAFKQQFPIKELDKHMEMIPQVIHALVRQGILKDENPPSWRHKLKNAIRHFLGPIR